jgi:hypothetical protein
MSESATLQCSCGEVRGRVGNIARRTVNRVVCYCADCQAFLHHIGRTDLFVPHAGTDIVQVAPATLSFLQGRQNIIGLRLSPTGLYRWYARCCRMPLGNTVTPAIPFVGLVAQAFAAETQTVDDLVGPPVGAIYGKFAVGGAPKGSTGFNPWLFARAMGMVLGWRLRSKTWPHPFFDQATRAPTYPVTTLARSERDALRPLCGPLPLH